MLERRAGHWTWVLSMLLGAVSAEAHQLYVHTLARGRAIEGRAYFQGDLPAAGALVRIYDAAGDLQGETTTDEHGQFRFECRQRADHRVVVDDGAGHRAVSTVRGEDLSPELGAEPGESRLPAPGGSDLSVAAELQSLNSQIVQLRRELDAYRVQVRWRDLIGGVGYLVGVLGLWFFVAGTLRQRAWRPASGDEQRVGPE